MSSGICSGRYRNTKLLLKLPEHRKHHFFDKISTDKTTQCVIRSLKRVGPNGWGLLSRRRFAHGDPTMELFDVVWGQFGITFCSGRVLKGAAMASDRCVDIRRPTAPESRPLASQSDVAMRPLWVENLILFNRFCISLYYIYIYICFYSLYNSR